MRKRYLFLMLFAATALNAQVAFLKVSDSYPDYDDQQPEQNAYNWFVTKYGAGNVVDMNNIPTDASTYKVLWVNVERNTDIDYFDNNLFPVEKRTALSNYVKAGGNLLLTKKASRLACHIGRMGDRGGGRTYYPSWNNSGYSKGEHVWTINAMIGVGYTLRDARQHPIFKNMTTMLNKDYIPESFPLIGMDNRSDDNCIWTDMESKAGGNTPDDNISTLNNFQSDWNCQVLAVWGHVRDYCSPAIVEFFPQNEYKGTVLSIGSNAYQWSMPNDYISNVQQLTENALTYLSQGGVEYGYYLPYSLSEIYSIDPYQPEYQAAQWFYDNYVVPGRGRFIHKDERFPTGMKVLWVHGDRVGQNAEDFYNAFGGDAFKTKLQTFVQAGGKVFLTKQANRFANDIGRCSWAPSYDQSGYNDGSDPWYMVSNFVAVGSGVDRHNHPAFQYMQYYTEHGGEGDCKWPLVKGEGTYKRSDHKYMWGEPGSVWSNTYGISAGTTDVARLNAFESAQNCQILGGWGHTTALDGVAMVEFFPTASFAGTVIAQGLPAYQWTTPNTAIDNVKKLTQGVLEYLSKLVEASWNVTPADGIIGGSMTASVTTTGTISWSSSDNTVASVSSEGVITYNGFGSCTITANVSQDGFWDTHLSQSITVTGGTPTKYAYALPYSLYTMSTYPNEDGTWKPDYQAAKWFYDNYVAAGKGCFINPTDYSASAAIPTTIKVLWVNNDHKDLSSEDVYNAFGGNDFRDALSAFVEADGNVFLSKQTTRFVHDIGRAKWGLSYEIGEDCPADGTWYMVDNFVAVDKENGGVNLHKHPVYATLRATKANQYAQHTHEGYCKWPLFDGKGNRTRMTYIWGEPPSDWNNIYGITENTLSIERLNAFESGMTCKILGGWGHTTALDAVGFAEFPPARIETKNFTGSMICIGLPAYQWSIGNTYIGNVRALTQGILDYLGGVVVVTEPETNLTNTTVDELVIYQGGSVSNTEDITINNSVTYIRPAVGGTAENELGHWYTFCLPFTPLSAKVLDEYDGFDYVINSVYLTGSDANVTEPEGAGHFYLQTFDNYDGEEAHWAYIGNEGRPTKDTPYIIKFLNATEDDGKGAILASYFTENPLIKFIGGAQVISGNEDGTGGLATGDFTFHVNKTLRKLTLSGIYPLNIETNMFEYDYGDESTIMPFECYIKASSPSVANACPRIMIGRKATQDSNITTPIENPTAERHSPVFVYDLMGRLCYEGMPQTLPSGIWIVRQEEMSKTIVIP